MKSILFFLLIISQTVIAQTNEEVRVKETIEKFRMNLLNPSEKELNILLHQDLSYGHSSAKIETKAEVIDILVNKKNEYKKALFENQKISIQKNTAIVRHDFIGSILSKEGKTTELNIKVLLVLKKEKGSWQLLARQGFKLPQ